MPFHRITGRFQLAAGLLPESRGDHRVLRAVGEEHRRRLIGRRAFGGEARSEQQVARQSHDAGELVWVARSGEQRHRAALGESRQYDTFAADAARVLTADQRLHRRL